MTGLEFRQALRRDFKYRYTSFGCYPLYLVLTDGAALCWTCAHAERARVCLAAMTKARDGWRPAGVNANWEDPELFCDHCGDRIESAYAEDEATKSELGG